VLVEYEAIFQWQNPKSISEVFQLIVDWIIQRKYVICLRKFLLLK
jgi:hypothetical protein